MTESIYADRTTVINMTEPTRDERTAAAERVTAFISKAHVSNYELRQNAADGLLLAKHYLAEHPATDGVNMKLIKAAETLQRLLNDFVDASDNGKVLFCGDEFHERFCEALAVISVARDQAKVAALIDEPIRLTMGQAADELARLRDENANLQRENVRINAIIDQQAERFEVLEGLLASARKFVAYDAQMAADLTRFAPLAAEQQALHDSTETESEKLLPLIDAALKTK